MFEFNASKIISYEEYIDLLKRLKQMFDKRKHEMFVIYNIMAPIPWNEAIGTYDHFRRDYNLLIQDVIRNSIDYFRRFLPEECLIVEFGSFVKGTERIHSDIDLTICYDEAKSYLYETVEVLIDYAIANTLGFSIDHVHGKFQHYPEMEEFSCLTESDNNYRIAFGASSIEYRCGPNALHENLTHVKNVRDYRSMLDGYEEKYKKKINIDCLYSLQIIENTTRYDFLDDMLALERRYDICEGYHFNLSPLILPDPFAVGYLKHTLKHEGIVEFYNFLVTLRKLMRIDNKEKYSMCISDLRSDILLFKLYGEDFVRKLFDSMLKLIFYWNRLEMSLLAKGVPLSTRCNIILSHDEVNEILRNDWGDTFDISMIVSAKNEMIDNVKEGLTNVSPLNNNKIGSS